MKRKPVYKGVKYIADKLYTYYPKKFPKKYLAKNKAREINKQLKVLNLPATLKNINSLVRKQRTGRKGAPTIDSGLLKLSYYFELADYPVYIARTSNEIFFTSKLFPSGVKEIQGGTLPVFESTFAPFVSYVNSISKFSNPDEKRYDTEWNVTCTPPVFNPSKKRWESKIISTDANGREYDYGFKPDKPTQKAQELILSGSKKQVEQKGQTKQESVAKPKETPETNAERVKEIRGLIADLRQDLKDGFITKEFYQQEVSKLTQKLNKGGTV